MGKWRLWRLKKKTWSRAKKNLIIKSQGLKKKLNKREDYYLWEIHILIQNSCHINHHMNYLHTFLKRESNIKFGKPWKRDYHKNPHYKSEFYLRIYEKLRKYRLKYNPRTGYIVDLKLRNKHYSSVLIKLYFNLLKTIEKNLVQRQTWCDLL